MYSFKNDYSDGGHPKILEALTKTYDIQVDGYGEDPFSIKAKDLIKKRVGSDDIDIHFLAGGTLTNLIGISSFLRPHEAVISAQTGHIYVHETGAIEATGHKVISVETDNGKITPEDITRVVEEHHFEHMVKPKLLYISQSTEIGTLYSKEELISLRRSCDAYNLYLYIDGARLGSAMASDKNDLTFADLNRLSDAFYIGGTKNGAMLGEALVINNSALKVEFKYLIKQRGGMLAKGRLLGVQFLTLFEGNLFLELAEHANNMAKKLQSGIIALGYGVQYHSYTNQIFPVFPESVITQLEKKYAFYRWNRLDENFSSIRLISAWNTREKNVDEFLTYLGEI